MPRKDFQRDLADALLPGAFSQLTDVRAGSEDGSFYFTYTSPFDARSIDVEVSVPDSAEYPRGHHYFVFTVSENVPETVPRFLEDSLDSFHGLPLGAFLNTVSNYLNRATSGDGDGPWGFQQDSSANNSDQDSSADEIGWEVGSDAGLDVNPQAESINVKKCIRADLRKARNAGFRVGYLGDPEGTIILSASRRISKLGISGEAMEAWGLQPSQYLVLLIRYPYGYRRLIDVVQRPGECGMIKLYAGVCADYKPSLSSALHVFANEAAPGPADPGQETNKGSMEPVLHSIFIGKSLQALLNSRFIDIVRYRLEKKFSWTGAELYMNDGQGRLLVSDEPTSQQKYFEPDWRGSPPSFLKHDHLANTVDPSEMSLLLVAMQFTLRRFVRCTEFCLNCYCRIDAGFEALKPFVCSNGLCLYQYMALGMGPSLEWEISSQPYVVDLLISFAYNRAAQGKLKDFPTGFPLKVPNPNRSTDPNVSLYEGKLIYDTKYGPTIHMNHNYSIKIGDWIVILLDPPSPNTSTQANRHTPAYSEPPGLTRSGNELHARVKDISAQPIIYLSDLIFRGHLTQLRSQEFYAGKVQFVTYDTDIGSLSPSKRASVALDLLDTLPSVLKMKLYIDQKRGGQLRPLSEWLDRINLSALYILQWIVGSNRSVIIYDNNPQHQIPEMESYIQFRFAQGAPDKEQRFVAAVNKTAKRLNLQYPTLFAWHGSPLHNWHSILREGLHYKEVVNGRSCGNGIYMAPQFNTSIGYSSRHHNYTSNSYWPHSVLKSTMAIALNEVVNAPGEFVCSDSCYVVQHLDWVQPRYLFVDSGFSSVGLPLRPKAEKMTHVYAQDPNRPVYGSNQAVLTIPISATNSHRSREAAEPPQSQPSQPKPKIVKKGKRKLSSISKDESHHDGDDDASVETHPEDRLMLLSGDEGTDRRKQRKYESLTDFGPGTLDRSSIQLLSEPRYATPRATRTLQRILGQALETQEKQPLHELGWYINGNLIDNVYQWIVELHSFDKSSFIAKDLEKANMTSIIMEMRFPADFPLVPPFLRIIRPRFVRFALGGGGHITAGGAMCLELLTNTGWLPSFSIESVLLQVRMAITNEFPRPARLDFNAKGTEYRIDEAINEYKRVCIAHGWEVPKDLEQIRW
ncbi:putative ubiquitin conjugating enzyme [Aspergillus foveolatus]|uniref:putative ubiquitin conjugating enzyme n=1 Tax=Aspergillus foveolatus TaxID=210207 RepID=UPI003CCDE855